MGRSLVGIAFLLLLATVALLGCTPREGPESPRRSVPGSEVEPEEVAVSQQPDAAMLAGLALPKSLAAPIDPAFEGWFEVGGISPTLLAIHPEGRSALVTVGYLSVLYDLQSGQELKSWTECFSVAGFSGDGKCLVTLGADPMGPYHYPGGALLPSGEELVIAHESRLESGDYRYEIVVYDLESGAPKHKFVQDDGRELHGFHVFPTGSMFMLWLNRSRVLYDCQKGCIVNDLPAPTTGRISPSSFSSDGRFVAVSALASANVTLHDPITLAPRKTLVNPFPVRWFKFSPDGKRLAAGQQSNLITMWDVDTARQLWTRRGAGNWAGTTTIFSDDGRRFLVRPDKDLSVLWDAQVGDLLCVVRGPSDTVVLDPSGESLHLGTTEGPMIWPELEEPLR